MATRKPAVFGITGRSGSGKTTLIEAVLPLPWNGVSVAAFLDAGHASLNGAIPGQPSSQEAFTAGIGALVGHAV